jgi:hypothetical protein
MVNYRSLEDHYESGRLQSQGVHKSQEDSKSLRSLPCLKKSESQESRRLANHRSQEAGDQPLVIQSSSLQQEEEKERKERETLVLKAW